MLFDMVELDVPVLGAGVFDMVDEDDGEVAGVSAVALGAAADPVVAPEPAAPVWATATPPASAVATASMVRVFLVAFMSNSWLVGPRAALAGWKKG